MFKNAILFRLSHAWTPDLSKVEKGLSEHHFVPCSPSQSRSTGFVEPRGEANGAMVESVGGQWMITLCVESKSVPGSVVQAHLLERLKLIEANTGRKPGRKESKDLKEEIIFELLPKVFPTQSLIKAWIDPAKRLMIVDASAQGKSDLIVTELVQAIEGFGTVLIQTTQSPAACMAGWLRDDESPSGFSIDRECELKATDDSKSVVRYGRHALNIEEVKQHIVTGKIPTRLAMTWNDRVSFVLSDTMQIKKIAFLDTVFEGVDEKEDGFDADVAIFTGEFSQVVDDMLEALGGELVVGDEVHEYQQDEDLVEA